MFNLLRGYAELGPVTLLCFALREADLEGVEALKPFTESVRCLPFLNQDALAGGGKLAAIRHAIHPLPRMVRRFAHAGMADEVESLLHGGSYDILHVERLIMVGAVSAQARAAAKRHGTYTVFDIDDLESTKMRRTAEMHALDDPRRYVFMLEASKLAKYEKRAFRSFDRTLVCSDKDRVMLQKSNPGARIQVVPNGANLESPDGGADEVEQSTTMLFLGGMEYPPNEDAAHYFGTQVLPLIRAKVPEARFVVAGRSPSARVSALHDGHSVTVAGFVPDIGRLFASSAIVVVPIRTGGGTRIKILEAMAASRAVVSTSVGCEGIDVTSGVDILTADAPEEFADACVKLLHDREARQAVAAAGRRLVFEKYRWARIRERFAASFGEVGSGDLGSLDGR